MNKEKKFDKEHITILVGDNKVSVKQTNSGMWYCSELSINDLDFELLDISMGSVELIIEKHNIKNKSKVIG